MNRNVNGKFVLRSRYNRKTLVFACFLFTIMLVSSCFILAFNEVAPFALVSSDKIVSNETELRNAINNISSESTIALGKDITLTNNALIIPDNKDITLRSNKTLGHYKLIGANNQSTIIVENRGVLRLNGIIVAHTNGATGCGVTVKSGGTLFLYDGEISNNKSDKGGGVQNSGNFNMSGGKISDNTAACNYNGDYMPIGFGGIGGGVYNAGRFSLMGGEISDNIADLQGSGGGVYNNGTFEMSGGKISNNIAFIGLGVSNIGVFNMSNGTISKNVASSFGGGLGIGGDVQTSDTFSMSGGEISGGGVDNSNFFSMSGGTISNSQRKYCVYNSEYGGIFVMSGGEISNNTGFGVYNSGSYNWGWTSGVFNMSGGLIRNNGGGVKNIGNFSMSGGAISDNIAVYSGSWGSGNGGGVQNSNLFNMSGGKISGNTAANGGGVYNYRDGNFSLSKNGVISNNKADIGGGVYNAGTFNRHDGIISDNTAQQYKDIYSHNGVGELPDVNGDGSSDGNNGLSDVNDFSLRNILIICVTVIGVVGAILFFIFKRGSFPIQINH